MEATTQRDELFPTNRAAAYLDVSPGHLRRLVREGAIRPVGRRGGHPRGCFVFTRQELDRHLLGLPVDADLRGRGSRVSMGASLARIRAASATRGE